MARDYKFSREIPNMKLVEYLQAGRPDAKRLLAIISHSYDYMKNLPLKGKGSSKTIWEKIQPLMTVV